MDFIFDTLFETPGKGEGAKRKKPWKGKIQASRASKCLKTTKLNWFNVAELTSQTPVPEVLRRPPGQPIRLGSDFTGYGTDNLACHYLGVNYQVAFVAERSSVKDTLRMALENMSPTRNPWLCILMSGSGRPRMHPRAMSSFQDLLVPHFRPLGKGRGPKLPAVDSCVTVCSILWTSFPGW